MTLFRVYTRIVCHMCGTWSWRTYEMHSVSFLKLGVTADTVHGGPQPIHQSIRWQRLALFQASTKGWQVHVEWWCLQSILNLKDFLSTPPVLTALDPSKVLLLYVTATTHVVSTFLVIERDELGHAYKMQWLVYIINEVLSDSKVWYPQV
jgi:hypothetical protein